MEKQCFGKTGRLPTDVLNLIVGHCSYSSLQALMLTDTLFNTLVHSLLALHHLCPYILTRHPNELHLSMVRKLVGVIFFPADPDLKKVLSVCQTVRTVKARGNGLYYKKELNFPYIESRGAFTMFYTKSRKAVAVMMKLREKDKDKVELYKRMLSRDKRHLYGNEGACYREKRNGLLPCFCRAKDEQRM